MKSNSFPRHKFFASAVAVAGLLLGIVNPLPSAFAAGPATKLVLSTSAAGAVSGAAFTTQPVITVQDASSQTVTGVAGTVSVRVTGGTKAGQLLGSSTATINAATGTATFSGLGITGTVGQTYTLTFSVGGLTNATQTISPTVGAASYLEITTFAVPSGGGQPAALATYPSITIKDSAGNTRTTDTTAVTVTSTAALTGTLSKAAVAGVATFTVTQIANANTTNNTNYTMTFTAGAITATQNFRRGGTGAPAATTVGAITGTTTVGSTLTPGAIGGVDGTPATNIVYAWKRSTVAIAGATNSTYVLTPSDLGTTITVTVTRTNLVGSTNGTSAATATITSVPDSPTLDSISRSSGQLSVTFTAPAITGGSVLTNYKYSTDGGTSWRLRASGTTGSPLVITTDSVANAALVNGTSYNVQIRAVNAVGDGVATGSIAATPATVPGTPTIGTATRTADTTATVAFTAPGSNGGDPITSYTATSTPGSITGVLNQAGSGTISVSGLSAGTDYTFTVRATNAMGNSSESSASNTAAAFHTVTFNGNGSTGGSTSPQTANTSTALTSNGFTRTGYTFTGWNTVALGGGTSYANGASYGFGADITLYAQWSANSNGITWNDQGATTPSSGGSANYTTGASVATIPTTAPLRTGYSFTGWNTAANGSGSAVTNGSYTPLTPFGAITLYAQWSANSNGITWNDQGATTASSGGSATYTTGAAVATIPTTAPLKTGYTFTGWNTASNGSGSVVTNGSYTPLTPFGAITLYAQWSANSGHRE